MCQYLDHPAVNLNFSFSFLLLDRAPFILQSDTSEGPQTLMHFIKMHGDSSGRNPNSGTEEYSLRKISV